MEPFRSAWPGVLVVLLQVIYGLAESPPCSNGFDPEVFVFRVHTQDLHKGTKLGRVSFIDCNGGTFHIYESSDKRFPVDANGTVILQTQVTLPEDQIFSVYTWDSEGNKHTASVRVEHEGRTSHYNGQQEDTEALSPSQSKTALKLPVLEPPRFSKGLRRRKREWVIPPMAISENDRGPFPKTVVQIKSSYASLNTMMYSVTGEGADQPPKGLFTMNKNTGWLYVTRPLDREEKDNYTLQAQAIAGNGKNEAPANITINVIDQNDNNPVFTQNPFLGSVPEASKIGFVVMTVTATDADDPSTANAIIGYSMISQVPVFTIDSESGVIRVNADGLDREKHPEYTLLIQAADLEGKGLTTTGTAVITVTDSNDNAPQFEKSSYTVSVPENKVGAVVVKLPVTDGDDPQSPAWSAKFRIINGNNAGFFNISTGPNKQEGIITTVKPLDFELVNKYTLLVVAENDVPFAKPLPTSTATVTVNVQDVNEAPVFDPVQNIISKPEDLKVGSEVTVYTATDPDTGKTQTVTYRIGSDPAGWLSVDGGSGLIKVKSLMDRESPYVNDGKYKALILATDDDPVPATGTGTLVIELQDVNDNTPIIEEREIKVCNRRSAPVLLSVTDKDGPGFAAPFSVDLQGDSEKNWTARMNSSKTQIILTLKTALEPGEYNVVLRVYDAELQFQDNTVQASVCECTGEDFQCIDRTMAGFGLFPIIGILGAILALLMLVLLLLLFLKRKKSGKEGPLIPTDDVRDDLYCYDEEGGGEEDQDYDLSVLHRGLDNRPGVFRNDEAPTFMPAPQYRPRPTNPEEIGAFLCDNLKAADNDPTAPPYDSLLVFDYEGGGSEAGSVSSLNSSSSGDQDYDRLHEWGPRFKKLADMFGGED